MEENKKQYLSLLSEIIAKEIIIFGPEVAILRARSVAGLIVDNNGNVADIKGDAVETVQKLVDGYVDISGQIVKEVTYPIFEKYPQIKKVD